MPETELTLSAIDLSSVPDVGLQRMERVDREVMTHTHAFVMDGWAAGSLGFISLMTFAYTITASADTMPGAMAQCGITLLAGIGGIVATAFGCSAVDNGIKLAKSGAEFWQLSHDAPLADVEHRLREDIVQWNAALDALREAIAELGPGTDASRIRAVHEMHEQLASLRAKIIERRDALVARAPAAQKRLGSGPA